MPDVDYSYHDISANLKEQAKDQTQSLQTHWKRFRQWLPEEFGIFSRSTSSTDRSLTIKVEQDNLWFLRFPLSAFCHYRVEAFACYGESEWIVTEKGFVRTWHERALLRKEMRDPSALLANSLVVMNTYSKMQNDSRCEVGTRLLVEMFCSCRRNRDGTQA